MEKLLGLFLAVLYVGFYPMVSSSNNSNFHQEANQTLIVVDPGTLKTQGLASNWNILIPGLSQMKYSLASKPKYGNYQKALLYPHEMALPVSGSIRSRQYHVSSNQNRFFWNFLVILLGVLAIVYFKQIFFVLFGIFLGITIVNSDFTRTYRKRSLNIDEATRHFYNAVDSFM